jgi:hypothetical protein
MGTLSSWAAFSLCHHTVVQWAALEAGRLPSEGAFEEYTLLGDDIVIADEAVANQYEVLMSQLDVSINRNKSVVATGSAEFAKRTFRHGEELSGLSWNLFSLAADSVTNFYQLINELVRRGYEVAWEGVLMATIGPSRERTITRNLRNLLLALLQPAGPLGDPDRWWAVQEASSVSDWWSASDDGGLTAEPGFPDTVEQFFSLQKRDRTYRQQLRLHNLAQALMGLGELVLKSQLREAELSRLASKDEERKALLSRPVTSQERERYEALLPLHPVVEVCKELLHNPVSTQDGVQLKVLTRSDIEQLYQAKDVISGSGVALAQVLVHLDEGDHWYRY